MKLGMNMLLWSTDVCGPEHDWTFAMLKEVGFDGVEIPIFDREVDKYGKLGERLEALGLERIAVGARVADDNPISDDPAVRAEAVAATRANLDAAAAMGASLICGPLGAPLGVFSGVGPTREEKARSGRVPAGGRAVRREARRDDRARISESFRDVPHEHRRRPGGARARGRPSVHPDDVRHLPRAPRREGCASRVECVQGRARARAPLGERPLDARRGPGRLGDDLRPRSARSTTTAMSRSRRSATRCPLSPARRRSGGACSRARSSSCATVRRSSAEVFPSSRLDTTGVPSYSLYLAN